MGQCTKLKPAKKMYWKYSSHFHWLGCIRDANESQLKSEHDTAEGDVKDADELHR